MVSRRLRLITGWALVVGAVGIFIDAWAYTWSSNSDIPGWLVSIITPAGAGKGSIGLIPFHLGVAVGMIGFVIAVYRTAGVWPALLGGSGVVGIFVFWSSYPAGAVFGGVGNILIGTVVLILPKWGRLASPLWVASGVLALPALVRPGVNWGPITSFTLLGAAVAVTGAFMLLGMQTNLPEARSTRASVHPAPTSSETRL